MVNEEDHLRVQFMLSGFRLAEVWDAVNNLDDKLEEQLAFAFSPQLGYLTACPTNVGTGIRVGVMLHLPGLVQNKRIDKVFRALQKINLAVRGLYGEGSQASGDFYQISNQQTLGKSELEVIKILTDVVPQVLQYERAARQDLLTQRRQHLHDQVSRAYGVLKTAQTITSEETMLLLSSVRMGINLGLIDDLSIATVNELFIQTQPAFLQKLRGSELGVEERNVARASYLRTRLSNGQTATAVVSDRSRRVLSRQRKITADSHPDGPRIKDVTPCLSSASSSTLTMFLVSPGKQRSRRSARRTAKRPSDTTPTPAAKTGRFESSPRPMRCSAPRAWPGQLTESRSRTGLRRNTHAPRAKPERKTESVHAGIFDHETPRARLVAVELLCIRYLWDDADFLWLTQRAPDEDRFLSCSLNISWPDQDAASRPMSHDDGAQILTALQDAFDQMIINTRVVSSRSRIEDDRFGGWLAYSNFDRAFKALGGAARAPDFPRTGHAPVVA